MGERVVFQENRSLFQKARPSFASQNESEDRRNPISDNFNAVKEKALFIFLFIPWLLDQLRVPLGAQEHYSTGETVIKKSVEILEKLF